MQRRQSIQGRESGTHATTFYSLAILNQLAEFWYSNVEASALAYYISSEKELEVRAATRNLPVKVRRHRQLKAGESNAIMAALQLKNLRRTTAFCFAMRESFFRLWKTNCFEQHTDHILSGQRVSRHLLSAICFSSLPLATTKTNEDDEKVTLTNTDDNDEGSSNRTKFN